MKKEAQIDVSDLTVSYGATPVLSGLSFSVRRGDFIGIIGPNGSGKTTLLRSLTGYLPSTGRIILDGKELAKYNRRDLARKIGMVPQKWKTDFAFTVEEVVLMGRFPHQRRFQGVTVNDQKIAQEAMSATNTLHLAERLITEISGGETQRVIIAQALAQSPQILFLDEPTAHLDIGYQLEICELLKGLNKRGLTIVMVLHDLNLAARYCQKLLLLSDGTIFAAGKVDQVLTETNLRKVYKVRALRRRAPLNGEIIMDFYPENTPACNSSLVACMNERLDKTITINPFIHLNKAAGVEGDNKSDASGTEEPHSKEDKENRSTIVLREGKEKELRTDLLKREGDHLKKGLTQVYTGEGKGKTTAALGVGLRAVGWGKKVLMIQFLKGRKTGELEAVKVFGERFRIIQSGSGEFIKDRNPTQEERKKAQEALSAAHKETLSGQVDLLILDEISYGINNGLVNLNTVIDLIKSKPTYLEIIMTGRNMPEDLIHHADLVSEIRQIKHYFTTGHPPRKGIEY